MEKTLTLTQIFSKRKQYIQEALRKIRVYQCYPCNKLRIDWRVFEIDSLYREKTIPIVLLSGFGSGWEGILPLSFSLVCEGYQVYNVSLPGYGNSDNPFWPTVKSFFHVAHSLEAWRREVGIEKFYAIGHSMGAEIWAKFAELFPLRVKKLVLLNPSGIAKINSISNKIDLAWRFSKSGMDLRKKYRKCIKESGEVDYIKPFIDWCGLQKSPWSLGRLIRRIDEFDAICAGTLPEVMEKIDVPVLHVCGELDTVIPLSDQTRIASSNLERIILAGIGHNPTLFQSEIIAAAIAHYLDK